MRTLIFVSLGLIACGDASSPNGNNNGNGDPSGGDAATSGGGDGGAPGDDSGGPPVSVTPGGPVLFFSDLTSGPRTGNSDTSKGQAAGADGALVSIWGKNLGDTQGASTVTVGGVAARVYFWGPATHGANLRKRNGMQLIELQIPGGAPMGSAPIQVKVKGIDSNKLAFTTRGGNIYFVAPSGNDSASGTFSAPFATFGKAEDVMKPGDVVYLRNGFLAHTLQQDTGLLSLHVDGTRSAPMAVVAYPGETATVGKDTCEPTDHPLVASYSGAKDGGSANWVISKLTVTSPASCAQDVAVDLGDGFRLVGNYISNPRTSDACQAGAVQCGGLGSCGSDVYILGNELEKTQTVNAATGSKQCHGFYISGNRQTNGVETNREIGWNYIHDCANNRAINIYNESYNGASAPRALIEGHRVHDNWVENQRGIGVLIGADVTGDNWLYNNIFVNTGLGPVFVDGGGFFPFQLQPGSTYSPKATTLRVHHNLVYGASFPEILKQDPNAYYAIGLVAYTHESPVTLDFKNNLIVSTRPGIHYLSSDAKDFTGQSDLWFGDGKPPAGESMGLNVDPMFVNPAMNDFHLGAGSQAKGAAQVVSDAPLDFDGIPRSNKPSVGPFE